MGRFQKIKEVPFFGKIAFEGYMKLQEKKRHIDNKKTVKNMSFGKGKKIFYLDVPVHANLGDIAQYICTVKWIKQNYPDYELVEIDGLLLSDEKSGIIEKIRSSITENDMIFFQSGYCTQDIGGYHDYVHRLVVSNIHNVPIVMLPQTVMYLKEENAKRTAQCYKLNNKIFFMARDYTSGKMAEKLFPGLDIVTYPDIVTTLIGTRDNDKYERNGILFCMRNDVEKYYSTEEIDKLYGELQEITDVSMCDTTVNERFEDFKDSIENYVNEMIDSFSKAKVVITDRYHGTIFSLIAGTPVIVLKTTDHKVKTGVEWFEGVYDDYVFYAQSLSEAKSLAVKLVDKPVEHQMKPYFKEEYYDKLRDKISEWQERIG